MEISIEAKNLSKEYPARRALNNITFKVAKGSIHGFLGPNGAGKTTTMKILTGLINQSDGEFSVAGKIGFLPENPPLYLNMTVDDYLEFVMSIYAEQVSKEAIKTVKEQCGLTNVGDRLIGNLSKGYKQRVGIAQALVHAPEIIILDEPTVGLDPVAIVEIRNLIESLKGKHTILFSSHQLHEVELLCDDITLVNHGEVIISGTLTDIKNKLTTNKHFKAKVLKFTDANKTEMLQKFPISSIELETSNGFVALDIFGLNKFKDQEDTVRITQYLTQNEIGLIDFKEEKLDLEEIFKRMTNDEGAKK